MRKKIFTTILVGACFALIAFAIPTSVNAQGGQLRYQNRYTKAQVGQIVTRLEKSSNTFKHDFNVELDHSPLNGTHTEDEYNGLVGRYEDAMDRLRKEFDRNSSWWMIRNEVSDVVTNAQPINNIINGLSFRRKIERQWNNMRTDLNSLADTFDLPGLNGGGWNGGPWTGGNTGGWNGGGQMSSPPSWARGTFYSTNGSNITLTLDASGRATVVNAGQVFYGTYYRGNLIVNNDSSSVRQIGNGIQTYNRNTGQTTNYSRTAWGSGPNWNGPAGGNMSTPPNWAQGTFYSTNGTNILLSINANGQVVATVNGQTYYGTYYNGAITLNNDVSTVTRNGDGIRTYNSNTGQTTPYRRQ